MQNLKFNSLDDFFAYLPAQELQMVKLLRSLVLNTLPDCKEKLAYHVPYYDRHYRVCFIWPASVPWAKVRLNGVLLGFCQGYLLPDELNYLDKGTRKQVYSKTFMSLEEIKQDSDLIKTYMLDARAIDNELKKNKTKP
ncbi:MAG: DUF1801 domain-containing protein [Microscillaceae bacterium]|nr:DUF1801 domain-containing protein [Microscillaceae bacterium]